MPTTRARARLEDERPDDNLEDNEDEVTEDNLEDEEESDEDEEESDEDVEDQVIQLATYKELLVNRATTDSQYLSAFTENTGAQLQPITTLEDANDYTYTRELNLQPLSICA